MPRPTPSPPFPVPEPKPDLELRERIARLRGCTPTRGWRIEIHGKVYHPDMVYCGCPDKRHRNPCHGDPYQCDGGAQCTCWPKLPFWEIDLNDAGVLLAEMEAWAANYVDMVSIINRTSERGSRMTSANFVTRDIPGVYVSVNEVPNTQARLARVLCLLWVAWTEKTRPKPKVG